MPHSTSERTVQRTRRVMQLGSVGFGIILVIYSLLILTGFLDRSPAYVSDAWMFVLCLAGLVYGVIQVGMPAKTKEMSAFRYLYFYIVLGMYIIMVAGFTSPIMYLWTAVVVSSFLYFGARGSVACLAILASLGVTDTVVRGGNYEILIENSIAFLVVWSVGTTVVMTMRGYKIDQNDVDQSKAQASLQQSRLTTLVNNLADAIISVDAMGEVTLYNAAALNLLDTNTGLEGSHLDDVLKFTTPSGASVSLVHELMKSTGVLMRDDLVLKSATGEQMRIEIMSSKIRGTYDAPIDEDLGGYIIILRDITKAKSLEEERDEFISVVSHELRTPITIAEGTISNAQVMMERDTASTEKLTEAVAMAHDQVIFLARMVNDLSTLSRAERGVADEPEEIDVKELVNDLYTEYVPEADKKDLHLDLHMPTRPGRVMASRLYLKELLQNFVTNAIKYTKEGKITVDVQRSRDGNVTFAVKDTGIGISKADQKRIFDKFYRAEDYRTRETSGTGLGLYVADKLARKLGVKIELKSRLNHGSTFSITLPTIKSEKASK